MASVYSHQQWMVLVSLCIVNFCNMACVSLQGPFFPAESQRRGASATQYGLVFSIFQLVNFIISPFYGKYISTIGLKFMYNAGVFITSTTCILFGFLNYVIDTNAFIGLALAIRIVEGLGTSAIRIVSSSMIAKEFTNDIGATYAKLQTSFGLGLIVGPAVGGFLYELGGFTLPFVVLGITLFASASVTLFLLPGEDHQNDMMDSGVSMVSVMKIPSIALFIYITIASSFTIGFQVALTEPHLRSFHLSPAMLGLVFIIQGAAYAITAPLWGWLCDKKITPKIVTLIGGLLVVISFHLFGPAPYIPFPNTLWGCTVALFISGVGLSGELVGVFSGMLQDVFLAGYPKNLSTYGVVSGIFSSAFSFGFFLGPVASGALMDVYGFRWASMAVVAMHLLVFGGVCGYLCCHRQCGVHREYSELSMDQEKLRISSTATSTSYDGIGKATNVHETTKPHFDSI